MSVEYLGFMMKTKGNLSLSRYLINDDYLCIYIYCCVNSLFLLVFSGLDSKKNL